MGHILVGCSGANGVGAKIKASLGIKQGTTMHELLHSVSLVSEADKMIGGYIKLE